MAINTLNLKKPWFIFLISTIFIILFLFYIDEGYYNFKWMLEFRNWVAFIIYFAPVYSCQLLVQLFLKRVYKWDGKIALSILLGIPLGLFIVIGLILG